MKTQYIVNESKKCHMVYIFWCFNVHILQRYFIFQTQLTQFREPVLFGSTSSPVEPPSFLNGPTDPKVIRPFKQKHNKHVMKHMTLWNHILPSVESHKLKHTRTLQNSSVKHACNYIVSFKFESFHSYPVSCQKSGKAGHKKKKSPNWTCLENPLEFRKSLQWNCQQ